jgi:hypothetical protein
MLRRPMATLCRPSHMTRPAILASISQRLSKRSSEAGVVITRLADLGGAHGYSQPGRITILESLTSADTAAVLVHEFAHCLLHPADDRPASRDTRELEAEAVAFVVGEAVGLHVAQAVDYLHLYIGDSAALAASLDRIQRAASVIPAASAPPDSDPAGAPSRRLDRALAGVE